MSLYLVSFRHTEEVDADNEADARRFMAQLVRENADESDCEADRIEGEGETEEVEG